MQDKSQPLLLINARLLQPILIGIRGFAYAIFHDTARPSPTGLLHKPCLSHEITPLHMPKRSATRNVEPAIEFD